LEKQSARIQRGERLHGKADFWGYVWQGADYEGLTCNALEWQMSEGGGNFLQPDRTVDVNNPAAIRAFARAARWVGTISPPGVLAYLEEDSRNMWESDRAMFLRNWSYVYHLAMKSPELQGRFAVAPMPAGVNPHSSAMGGWYLGVSKYTIHLPEAIAFVKYMTGQAVQKKRAMGSGFLPTFGGLYRDPAVLKANPFFVTVAGLPGRAVRRPAAISGSAYDSVSRAYAHGVHLILAGKVTPAQGAADIQAQIEHLTGFAPTSSPVPGDTGERSR
jgi:trehalose/maltose transport system substrate-binding protein